MAENSAISWTAHKLCTKCRVEKPRADFSRDRTRADGLTYLCRACRSTGKPLGWYGRPNINPVTGRSGSAPHPQRDDDRVQARQRVNVEVQSGRRLAANNLPCADCGHVWREGGCRHEYHHHLGYGAEHHLDVIPVCTVCHHRRDNLRAAQTHCIHGHEFMPEDTFIPKEGGRACRQCRRTYDSKRVRPPGYWKAVNACRKERVGKKAAGRLLDGVEHNGMPEVVRA